jgi:nitric oxide reductase NorE protein
MWFFVIGDLWIFACYFIGYSYDRAHDASAFLDGQRLLSPGMGVLNTAILLTSSLFVALCAQATRAGDITIASRFIALGGTCGAAFLVTKVIEWHAEVSAGFPPSTYPFFTYYFTLTGLHFLHVLLGLLILALGWRELRKSTKPRAEFVEASATYWHMVDSLWIAIFAALYLMR